MRALLRACVLLLVAIAAATAARAQAPKQRLSLDDFLEWEKVESPVISPDGRQIIYTRRSVDAINDRWRSESWIVNTDGTRNRFLMNETGVVWSPDGTRIAYTAPAPGEPRGRPIFVRLMDEAGTTTQITRVQYRPRGLQWSPDGESIAFGMWTPKPREPWDLEMPSPPPGADWVAAPRVEGVGYPTARYIHIYVVSVDGGTPRPLTDGEWRYRDLRWSPDGTTIFATGEPEGASTQTQIYAIDVASRETRALTSVGGGASRPRVSPDGRLVAYLGRDSTTSLVNPKLYVMHADGSDTRELLGALDRSPTNVLWAPDNSGLYFGARNHGRVNLYSAPVSGEGARAVTEGDHLLQPRSMSSTGRMAALRSDAMEPVDVVVFDIQRPEQIRKLTDVNGDILAERRLGETEEIWYTSYDGLEIQGWIVKPPDFDPSKEYPLVLGVHGGAPGMYGFGATNHYWFDWQYLASRGYVVLYTNPRGSAGYGSAFADAVTNRFPGGGDYQDLMFGVDEVVDRGYIDTDNMFVEGCSGGGALTSWIVGHTDRFAAASANCIFGNWISTAAAQRDGGRSFFYFRPFWEDPTPFLEHSPIMYVENVTTPTLLIVGAEDPIPPSQAQEFYNALSYLGVPTARVVLTDEGHGFHDRPSNYIRAWAMMHSWFQRWSDGGERVGASGR